MVIQEPLRADRSGPNSIERYCVVSLEVHRCPSNQDIYMPNVSLAVVCISVYGIPARQHPNRIFLRGKRSYIGWTSAWVNAYLSSMTI